MGKPTGAPTTIMKAKTIIIAFTLLISILTLPTKIHAQEVDAGSSATLHSLLAKQRADNRVAILRAYLNKFNSPLAAHAETFVAQADLYQIDWRFVAAIAGRESSFAKAEPCINPFGYGIYGSTMTCFSSYDEAIRTVSKALRENYMNKWDAHTVWDIGKLYAASPTWASGVMYFMNNMQTFAYTYPQSLPISL